jgi:hypothetical protein
MTRVIGRQIELDLKADMAQLFPGINIKRITIDSITPLTSGNREIQISMFIGDDGLKFVANYDTITSVNDDINALTYIGTGVIKES